LAGGAATADAWAGLSPRQIKARRVARLVVAAGGNAGNVDVVSLSDIEVGVGAAQTTAGELRQEAQARCTALAPAAVEVVQTLPFPPGRRLGAGPHRGPGAGTALAVRRPAALSEDGELPGG
jgi:hypothetical protein